METKKGKHNQTDNIKENGQENGQEMQMPTNDQLKHDLDLIFTYARCHSTTTNPSNENELIHIINLKMEVYKRLKLIKV